MSKLSLDPSNSSIDEDILFVEEDEPELSTSEHSLPAWKILVVDDEPEIHQVTKLALSDLVFENQNLQFLNAYSGQEAKEILQKHSDIAMIFLDVIMETTDAGLELVHYVREVLNNKLVRIVLRTGQPGECPEDVILLKYDINDYKTKTELTRQKLFTKVITSLRGYSTLVQIEKSKTQLATIALENAKLYERLEEYALTLEEKVSERTQELELKNQQLKQEIQERKRIEIQLKRANEELNRLAKLDGLTQVANRRCFNEYLLQQWQNCFLQQKELSLMLCDVDYFKWYNDHYGHLSGDDCLQKIAIRLDQAILYGDKLVARYGGEEFAVVLPKICLHRALKMAQTVQDAIAHLSIPHARSTVNPYITLSIGIYSQIPDPEQTPDILIQRADQLLYQAKREGRNRICY